MPHTPEPRCGTRVVLRALALRLLADLFRFSWKWRRRSPSKVMERTHEEATETLPEKEPVSKLCGELGLQPTVFYRWQKEFFDGAAAFEQKARPIHSAEQERIAYLEPRRADGGARVPPDTRDQIVDFVRRWSGKTEIGAGRFIGWLDSTASFWLEDWEKQAIIGFHVKNPLEGYRRLTLMMLDADIVAASPTSVGRVLGQAGLFNARKAGSERLAPHDLRRTCARLCHAAGGELEQIQFLLGHVSIRGLTAPDTASEWPTVANPFRPGALRGEALHAPAS